MTTDAVECEVRINARPETVFAFFTDPQKLVAWKGIAAELTPRPGGLYRVSINASDIVRGQYVAIEPPHRIVFTWGWEGEGHPIPPGSSTVEITLTADGDGTLLRLRHGDLPAGVRADHAVGWDHYLPRLAIVAAGGDPGPDPWVAGAAANDTSDASTGARV